MNIVLWFFQILLAFVFLMAGGMKAFQYERAKAKLPWVGSAPRGFVAFVGLVEVLGAIGLVLPALTGILPILTPLAALGLAIVMLIASGFNLSHGEHKTIVLNVILLVMAAFVVYGRLVLVPVA